MKNRKSLLSAFVLSLALSGCASTGDKPAEQTAEPVNDFPTQDRVEFVLGCIEKKGGLRYETLYPCICSIDKIATKMSYQEYAQAKTFTFMHRTPGDNGGIFRDPPQANKLRKKLKDAEKFAEDSCFVK